MICARKAKLLAAISLVGLVIWATSAAYGTYVDRWQGDLRAPLIVGSLAGVVLIVFVSCTVTKCEEPGEAATTRDNLGS